jgi:cytochrome b561
MTNRWMDTPKRYGLISRCFHWVMAALFAWQFLGALLYVGLGDTALTRGVGQSHFALGFTLFIMVGARGVWGLANLQRRPLHSDMVGRIAVAGHTVLYALMVLVPGLALMRQYGSGEAFSPYAIPLMAKHADKIGWMIAPADLLHHNLAYVLFALILGHATMPFIHRHVRGDDVLQRMR